MRLIFKAILAFAAVAFDPTAKAAVIFSVLPEPVLVRDEFFGMRYPIDIDGNGTIDFTLSGSPSFSGLRTERANRAIYRTTPPPDLGGPVPPLPSGYIISSTLAPITFGELSWRSSDILGGYVDPDEIAFITISSVLDTGSSSLFPTEGLRAPIGVEFEANDGVHYGYIDIWARRGYSGVIVYGWAYESNPGTSITAGLVPEPSTSGLLMLGGLAIVTRRRRDQPRHNKALHPTPDPSCARSPLVA